MLYTLKFNAIAKHKLPYTPDVNMRARTILSSHLFCSAKYIFRRSNFVYSDIYSRARAHVCVLRSL